MRSIPEIAFALLLNTFKLYHYLIYSLATGVERIPIVGLLLCHHPTVSGMRARLV
jgi:hypothetical protein